ncbi:unnamed protein product, partial [Prorocentrum cordatum]
MGRVVGYDGDHRCTGGWEGEIAGECARQMTLAGWTAPNYHFPPGSFVLTPSSGASPLRNCVDFAEHFVVGLHTTEPFPAWVHGLAKGLPRNTRLADLPGLSLLDCSKSSAAEAKDGLAPPAFCGGAPEGVASGFGGLLQRMGSLGSMPPRRSEAGLADAARGEADRRPSLSAAVVVAAV